MEKKPLYGRVTDIVKTKTNKNNFQIKDNKEIVVHNIANNFTGNAINTFGVSLYLISTGESQNVENANNTKEEKGNINVPINTSKPLISLSERIDFLFDQVINNDNNIKSFHQISLPAHMIVSIKLL